MMNKPALPIADDSTAHNSSQSSLSGSDFTLYSEEALSDDIYDDSEEKVNTGTCSIS